MALAAADLVNFPAPTQFTIPIHWDTILEEDGPFTLNDVVQHMGLDEFQCDLNDYILPMGTAPTLHVVLLTTEWIDGSLGTQTLKRL